MRLNLAAAAMGLIGASLSAHAQSAPARHGWTAAVGAGSGSASIYCFNCTVPTASSVSGFARLGYAVLPNLVLDAQARRWAKSNDATDDDYNFFLLGAQVYPRRAKRFHFEVGLGYADASFKSPGSPDTLQLQTAAVSGGIGYDLPISRTLFLTPFFNAIATSTESPKYNHVVITSDHPVMRVTVLQLGAAIGWQRIARRRYIPAGERGR
jgi:hypothetical protein